MNFNDGTNHTMAVGHCDQAPALSVIIISYCTCALTLRTIGSVLSQEGPSLEVIVVDNASTDGSAAAIARDFPMVRLITLDTNLGFARANNLAALQANGSFLLLLNPDTVALPNALIELWNFAQFWPTAVIWGGRIVGPDGSLNPRSCKRRPTLWSVFCIASGLAAVWPGSRFFNPEAMPGWERDEMRHVDIVIGCFLMIRRDDWKRLGGFDPAYFMYGEDADLCLRAAKLGGRPAITPRAVIMHDEGASQLRNTREVQLLAARIRYLRSHLPTVQKILAIWAVRLGTILRVAGFFCMSQFAGNLNAWARMRYVWDNRSAWWNGYPDLSEESMSGPANRHQIYL